MCLSSEHVRLDDVDVDFDLEMHHEVLVLFGNGNLNKFELCGFYYQPGLTHGT